jgi:hypothetical protein
LGASMSQMFECKHPNCTFCISHKHTTLEPCKICLQMFTRHVNDSGHQLPGLPQKDPLSE